MACLMDEGSKIQEEPNLNEWTACSSRCEAHHWLERMPVQVLPLVPEVKILPLVLRVCLKHNERRQYTVVRCRSQTARASVSPSV